MTATTSCMPRRRKCAATTREEILAAARERFLQESYDSVGLRDIARDVGVDVALVGRYFGSKEELFRQVLRGGHADQFSIPGDLAELPAFFAAMRDEMCGGDLQQHREKLLIMLRSAASPIASEVIRDTFAEDVLDPLAKLIGGEDAYCRAVLAMSLLIGTNFLQTVLPVKPFTEQERACHEAELTRLLDSIVRGKA
jgi:AcrR family transcriptional regulator